MNEFYLYTSRKGRHVLTPRTREAWDWLLQEMQDDNRVTFEEAKREGFDIEGSYEDGWLFMDDGGEIRVITLTEPR